jgi:carboxylesterase type B
VIGACHCHELVPLFGGKGLEGLDIMMGLSEDDVRKAGKQIRRLWTEFARTGIIQNTQIDDMLTLTKQ